LARELLKLEHINKSYEERQILEDLNLTVHENEFLTLLGPSGCGKTTILRMIGGFETPDSGHILFDGQDITRLQPEKRQVNTVFQKYSLFSHMDVAENIAFGLKLKGKSDSYIRDKIKYALKLVNLDGYEHARVTQMSGGQQQRIAIARAVVNEPKVLLLDEPFSALDLKLRQSMQREIVKLKKELGITFIFVTHDQQEALSMSDTVVVMNQGWIQQIGTPESVYNEPENAFVADFIGDSNIIDGVMVRDKLVHLLGKDIPCINTGFGENVPVDVQIRPEDIQICAPADGQFRGIIRQVVFKGTVYDITIEAGGFSWLVQTITGHEQGAEVGIRLAPANIQIMAKPASEDEEAVSDE